MNSNTVCGICYEVSVCLSCNIYTCSKGTICLSCFQSFLNFCLGENIICQCISEDCKGEYLIIPNAEYKRDLVELHSNVIVKYLSKEFKNEILEKQIVQTIVERIQKEKKTFIEQRYPEAVKLVGRIAFSDRINHVDKKKITNVNVKKKFNCFREFCIGKLNDDLKCNVCITHFCKKCQKILKGNHKCLEEDLKSIKMIEEITKCPTCHSSIEKIKGCDHMTCRICGTHYSDRTGNILTNYTYKVPLYKPFEFKEKVLLYPRNLQDIILVIYNKLIDDTHFKTIINCMSCEPQKRNIMKITKHYIGYKTNNFIKQEFFKMLGVLELKKTKTIEEYKYTFYRFRDAIL
jgi:hypothetical protein